MSRKVSFFRYQLFLFEVGLVVIASIFLMMNSRELFVVYLLQLFCSVFIFANSAYLTYMDKSLLGRLNFKRKIIRPQIFFWNFALYGLSLLLLLAFSLRNSAFFIDFLIIFTYQTVDVILLRLRVPSAVFYISFLAAVVLINISLFLYHLG